MGASVPIPRGAQGRKVGRIPARRTPAAAAGNRRRSAHGPLPPVHDRPKPPPIAAAGIEPAAAFGSVDCYNSPPFFP